MTNRRDSGLRCVVRGVSYGRALHRLRPITTVRDHQPAPEPAPARPTSEPWLHPREGSGNGIFCALLENGASARHSRSGMGKKAHLTGRPHRPLFCCGGCGQQCDEATAGNHPVAFYPGRRGDPCRRKPLRCLAHVRQRRDLLRSLEKPRRHPRSGSMHDAIATRIRWPKAVVQLVAWPAA